MNRKTFGRVTPNWFTARCVEASLRAELAPRVYASYRTPGRHLAIHWWGEVEAGDREIAARELRSLDRRRPEQALIDWMHRYLPHFVVCVPSRRRPQLARGFLALIQLNGQ